MWEYYVAFQMRASEELTPQLSSAPCTPAPGRRIIIIRCDNQVSPANLFVSFDRVVPPAPSEPTIAPRRNSSSSLNADSSSSDSSAPPKRKWNILKSVFGVSASKSSDTQSSSSSFDESEISDAQPNTGKCLDTHPPRSQAGTGEPVRPKTAHQPFFFKFSLEWMDRPQWPTKNRRLLPPALPSASQLHLQKLRQSKANKTEYDTTAENAPGDETKEETKTGENATDEQAQASTPVPPPKEPPGLYHVPKAAANDKVVASKYVGRSLSEWALIVIECDSFFARRRDEGVPCDRMVETPTLGVESFRK